MSQSDPVFDKLQAVFRDVFEDPQLQLTPATTSADIEGWDSIMHVTLIVNVEKAFGVRFKSSELGGLKNVGALVELVKRYA